MIPTSQLRADAILSRLGIPNPRVAEIGVLAGVLSSRLLSREDLHLTMVDNWLGDDEQPAAYLDSGDPTARITREHAEFSRLSTERRTAFAGSRATIRHADSVSAAQAEADQSFDLVFIDARHDLEGVREDIAAWSPKVKPGGWLSGHDYAHKEYPTWGVKQAVDEFVAAHGLVLELDVDYSWFVRMPGPIPETNPKLCHKNELVVACVMVGDYEGRGEEYVRALQDQVGRNLRDQPYRFVCLSDRELPGVECIQVPPWLKGWWAKLYLFEAFKNRCVLFFDLDTVIVGPLEPVLDKLHGSGFAALHDWYRPDEINSAMMYWEGDNSDIWHDWLLANMPTQFLRSFGDQAWIMQRRPNADRITVLAPDAVKSYKAHELDKGAPAGASVIAFHGRPRPHELTNWVADFWKVGGLASPRWLSVLNNSDSEILANVKINQARKLPVIEQTEPGKCPQIALCCGGPSLALYVEHIALLKRAGVEIWAVNGVADFLAEHGVIADVHVLLDSREWNSRFVKNSRAETKYLIASQAHPAVFDELEANRRWVTRWDSIHPGVEADLRIAGGATVALKSICLALILGYREFHIFGMDGSFVEGSNHHAYAQPENDAQLSVSITAAGREFHCPRWGAKQARELMDMMPMFLDSGAVFDFYGDGLIQWCMKNMVKSEDKDNG